MAFVLRRANVSQQTWVQWKKGIRSPMKENWDRVASAVQDLERWLG